MQALFLTRLHHGLKRTKIPSATLFAKSKNVMLSNLFADVVEEEGAGAKGGGKKKGGGSMQTISATHRVRFHFSHFQKY